MNLYDFNSAQISPIRRIVKESVSSLNKLVKQESKPDSHAVNRKLRYENLEDRRVLSVNGFEADQTQEVAYVAAEHEIAEFGVLDDEILHLKVLVNGEVRTLTPNDNSLELVAGDRLEVVEIGFYSSETTGVFAAEGYVNKISDLSSASMVDYNDGRFSGGDRDSIATGAFGRIGGLANEWIVESGWDRVAVNLMHYDVESTEVSARFFAHLQVGQPDFEFDTDYLDTILEKDITVGDKVTIPAKWLNSLGGNFHNYAEVDIYHESDLETIVWAGAAVGNASQANAIEGEFLNLRDDDSFSERWSPDAPGEYVLKYYIDPEKFANESNEENNEYEIRLNVEAKPAPIAVDDSFDAGESLDVMNNDIHAHEQKTIYAEGFESDSLGWTINPNGTDTATTGLWESTVPVGTSWNGVQLQLENTAEGQRALVTGGSDDGSVGFDDIDGGVTSALSEQIAVPANSSGVLSFKYNFATLSNSDSEDYFRVTIIGEDSSKVILEEHGNTQNREGNWVEFTGEMSEFAGQSIQILVEAADNGSGSLVEAGIDDVRIEIPATPMFVNEVSQGEHGSVSMNADGTLKYTPDAEFEGEDRFQYTLSDGESVSNVATVVVNVDNPDFDVSPVAIGNEDSEIELKISTDFEQVRIDGVPEGAVLSHGQPVGEGVYDLQTGDLSGLTLSPALNSDADFLLTVTPGENGVFDDNLSKTIEVVVNAVVDGGNVEFSDFGIVTGKSGRMPITGGFTDVDGSESHRITINGLPDFITFSAGTFDGVAWTLEASDLDRLKITAMKVDDLSDWERLNKKNYAKKFEVRYAIESFEENGFESTFINDSFELTTIQKKKR